MNKRLKQIYDAFDGKLVGSKFMQIQVCKTLLVIPSEMINFITGNCWFVGSMDDAYAFTFTGNDLRDKHMIFLSDELLREDESQIRFSILHEIGHVVLNHRNSVFVHQAKAEIKKQEKQADIFAKKYLGNGYSLGESS